MARSRYLLISFAVAISVILIAVPLLAAKHYLLFSILFMLGTFLPFMIRFERRKVLGRELVILAILAAIAAVSRVPFASIPSVQPTTFVIILTGFVFGAESGFVVGALAALVSNLFLGQGPWTPWQMYAWGMIGLCSGLLSRTWIKTTKLGRLIFGFITGILFGWIMNLWYFVSLGEQINLVEVLAYYSASFYFDLAHAISNVFFLLLFATSWIKILERFKKKYGLLG